MTKQTRIILVDDHAVVRAGFRMLLAASDNMEVIAEAERGEQAIQQYLNLKPDILIMDLSMPGIGGLETIRRIVQRDDNATILVFSVHHEQVYVNRALNAGAKGYITKNSAAEMLAEAIATVMLGRRYVEPGLLKGNGRLKCADEYQNIVSGFSEREFDVFKMLAEGQSPHKIAGQLCLGYKTVANYATRIRKKLQTDNIIELVRIAEDLGIMQQKPE